MKTECRITVTQSDGKLYLIGNIPENAKPTIAGKLTQAMLDHGNTIMNDAKRELATSELTSEQSGGQG